MFARPVLLRRAYLSRNLSLASSQIRVSARAHLLAHHLLGGVVAVLLQPFLVLQRVPVVLQQQRLRHVVVALTCLRCCGCAGRVRAGRAGRAGRAFRPGGGAAKTAAAATMGSMRAAFLSSVLQLYCTGVARGLIVDLDEIISTE